MRAVCPDCGGEPLPSAPCCHKFHSKTSRLRVAGMETISRRLAIIELKLEMLADLWVDEDDLDEAS